MMWAVGYSFISDGKMGGRFVRFRPPLLYTKIDHNVTVGTLTAALWTKWDELEQVIGQPSPQGQR